MKPCNNSRYFQCADFIHQNQMYYAYTVRPQNQFKGSLMAKTLLEKIIFSIFVSDIIQTIFLLTSCYDIPLAYLLISLYNKEAGTQHLLQDCMCVQRNSDQPVLMRRLIRVSLSAWRHFGSVATHKLSYEESDQTSRMPKLILVFAGRIGNLLWNALPRFKYLYHFFSSAIVLWFLLSLTFTKIDYRNIVSVKTATDCSYAGNGNGHTW